jgi:hypothetical protein
MASMQNLENAFWCIWAFLCRKKIIDLETCTHLLSSISLTYWWVFDERITHSLPAGLTKCSQCVAGTYSSGTGADCNIHAHSVHTPATRETETCELESIVQSPLTCIFIRMPPPKSYLHFIAGRTLSVISIAANAVCLLNAQLDLFSNRSRVSQMNLFRLVIFVMICRCYICGLLQFLCARDIFEQHRCERIISNSPCLVKDVQVAAFWDNILCASIYLDPCRCTSHPQLLYYWCIRP